MKVWYCPSCGYKENHKCNTCKECGASYEFVESKRDWTEYAVDSYLIGAEAPGEVFFKEVMENPLFDESAHESYMRRLRNISIPIASYATNNNQYQSAEQRKPTEQVSVSNNTQSSRTLYVWYCPVCGRVEIKKNNKCEDCGSTYDFIQSKRDFIEYVLDAMANRNSETAGDILFKEVMENPLFDATAHESYLRRLKANRVADPTKDIPMHEPKRIDTKIQVKDDRYIPRCPTCQSTNIKKISAAKRGLFGGAFGWISKTARSQFECMNCGYMW